MRQLIIPLAIIALSSSSWAANPKVIKYPTVMKPHKNGSLKIRKRTIGTGAEKVTITEKELSGRCVYQDPRAPSAIPRAYAATGLLRRSRTIKTAESKTKEIFTPDGGATYQRSWREGDLNFKVNAKHVPGHSPTAWLEVRDVRDRTRRYSVQSSGQVIANMMHEHEISSLNSYAQKLLHKAKKRAKKLQ